MSNQIAAKEIATEVKAAAERTARAWDGVIDPGDAEQEIWIRLLEAGADYADKVSEMDPGAKTTVLDKIGHQIASQYRDDYEMFSGNYWYGTDEVRQMLDDGALERLYDGAGDGVSAWQLSDDEIESIQSSYMETVTERIDLTIGLKRLFSVNSNYGAAVVNRYVHLLKPETGSQRMTLSRAVDGLTREMNRGHQRRVADFDESRTGRTR